jgi:hypothetical protein
LVSGGQTPEESVAEEEGGRTKTRQPLERLEHVQVEPVARVQGENGRQAGVEAERPERVATAKAGPQIQSDLPPLKEIRNTNKIKLKTYNIISKIINI